MSAVLDVITLQEELLEAEQRLTREHPDIPAGTVLRCHRRAVHRTRAWGCPPEHLARTAEVVARWMLAQRGTTPG